MIPRECKRLAEVDFPIAEVSRHAVREKSARRGHPSTLHLWWARRPLASSRAMLMALLLPDPCDPHCPEAFRKEARRILLCMHGRPKGWTATTESDDGLRRVILKFVADFANWDRAADRTHVEVGRALVKAAHGEHVPLVVDPFAGGGSIPLEALRLGCDAFASDLNPVACLILKVMLEDIPHHGPKLADALRRSGDEIRRHAEQELADLYPADPDGATPIAYLWARTVRCEASGCGAEIPIYKTPWLSKKNASRARFFKEKADGSCRALLVNGNQRKGPVTFRIARGEGSEEPRKGFTELKGTKAKGNNANVICPCCDAVLPGSKRNPRVQTQLVAQRGGADVVFDENGQRTGGARLLAVVTLRPGEKGRHYRLPTDADYAAVHRAQAQVARILAEWERGGRQGLCPVPSEPLPPVGTLGFRVQRYGMLLWGDLFTARQKAALVDLLNTLPSSHGRLAHPSEPMAPPRKGSTPGNTDHRPASGGGDHSIPHDGVLSKHVFAADKRSVGLASALACAFNRVSMSNMSCTRWNAVAEKMQHTFGRQALPIVWDFAEVAITAEAPGNWKSGYKLIADVVDVAVSTTRGQIQPADATHHPLPDQSASVWFTDPPYYDAVPYADLSDFFLVWLKRALPDHPLLRDPFDAMNSLSPKIREAVQDETKQDDGRPKDRAWFEETMARAFAEGRRVLHDDGVGSVVFAHKTTEGWEALLSGMIRGGWTITGSWPIATEMATRLRARDSAALATSVHLICRPRPDDAPVGDWAHVLRELPRRVATWMERLQNEGIRGADLVFACVGPALEIFSRYRAVETAEGREVGLPEYLEKVWEVVGRTALENVLGTAEAKARNGGMGALEEDARLTALFLWTLQSTEAAGENGKANTEDEETIAKAAARGFNLPFDVVRRFAQPMGIDLDRWTGRIIGQEKGVVRLLPVSERASDLFGKEGVRAAAGWIESNPHAGIQQTLFPEFDAAPMPVRPLRGKAVLDGDAELQALDATALDRVHAAMLLQASGHANALRALIAAEQDRGPDFLRLANALSALYPRGSQEKRLLDAMLLAVPR